MTKKILLIPVIALSVLVSCQSKEDDKSPSVFAAIDNYFQQELQQLKKSDLKLTKKMIYKENTEVLVIDDPDWANELVPFTETLSNQQTKIQKFDVDSSMIGSSTLLKYTSKDAASVITSLSVHTTNGINDSIIIIKQVSNAYYKSSDTLIYYGGGNYFIKAENLPGIGKKMGFILEGKTISRSQSK